MSQVWVVVRREHLERVRTKGVVAEAALASRLSDAKDWQHFRGLLDGGTLIFGPIDRDELVDNASRRTKIVGIGRAVMLFMVMPSCGTAVLMSVMSEKANRIVEVLITSTRSWPLVLGKVVGVGAIGLTQMGIWAVSAVLLGLLAVPVVAAYFAVANTQHILSYTSDAGILVLFLAFYVLAYFLYAGLYAAMTEPSANWYWLALFPFWTSILMFPRVVAGPVPSWTQILSLVLMAFATIGTAWVAGRIYQTCILMQDKRPTLREVVRWIRASPPETGRSGSVTMPALRRNGTQRDSRDQP